MHKSPLKRLLSRISRVGECWIVNGATTSGYGIIWDGEKNSYCHRLMYEHYKGEIPNGLFVIHSCHNRRCVNPEHLRLGTAKENTQDMMRAGRHAKSYAPHIGYEKAKEIEKMMWNGYSYEEIAEEYNLPVRYISYLLREKRIKSIVARKRIETIREMFLQGLSGKEIASTLGVSESLVSKVRTGAYAKHVKERP